MTRFKDEGKDPSTCEHHGSALVCPVCGEVFDLPPRSGFAMMLGTVVGAILILVGLLAERALAHP